jgi:hypothetical protein
MPPQEKKNSFKGKLAEKTATAKTGGIKSTDGALHQPMYLSMGKKRVHFVAVASDLDQVLKKTYGVDFTISKLEKSFLELKGKSQLRDLIHLPDEILALHAAYVYAKAEMVEESSLLRKSFLAAPIAGSTITTADELFAEPSTQAITAKAPLEQETQETAGAE